VRERGGEGSKQLVLWSDRNVKGKPESSVSSCREHLKVPLWIRPCAVRERKRRGGDGWKKEESLSDLQGNEREGEIRADSALKKDATLLTFDFRYDQIPLGGGKKGKDVKDSYCARIRGEASSTERKRA